jgi:hypothetical protein
VRILLLVAVRSHHVASSLNRFSMSAASTGGRARTQDGSRLRQSRDRLVIAADFTDTADHPQCFTPYGRPPGSGLRPGRGGVAVLNRGESGRVDSGLATEAGPVAEGTRVASSVAMIEQPAKPDVPRPPDVLKRPPPVNTPVPPGEPAGEDRPDTHPAPPPTDPAPPEI